MTKPDMSDGQGERLSTCRISLIVYQVPANKGRGGRERLEGEGREDERGKEAGRGVKNL